MIEEDDTGNAMYIVLSGQCQVRARPEYAVHPAITEESPATAVAASEASSSTAGSDSDDEQSRCQSGRPATAPRSEAEHTATYWIHKYMEQVYTEVHALHKASVVIILHVKLRDTHQAAPNQQSVTYFSPQQLVSTVGLGASAGVELHKWQFSAP